MNKKLVIFAQIIGLFGALQSARAENVTYNVFENGRPVGTMTIPSQQYPNVVERMRGSGVTFQRPVNADRRAAAETRMEEWKRQDEARRAAALEKQRQLQKQDEVRRVAAERRVEDWKRENEQRQANAQAQQERFKRDNEARRTAAERKVDEWNRQSDARRVNAQAQQEQWRRQMDDRQAARGGGMAGALNRAFQPVR